MTYTIAACHMSHRNLINAKWKRNTTTLKIVKCGRTFPMTWDNDFQQLLASDPVETRMDLEINDVNWRDWNSFLTYVAMQQTRSITVLRDGMNLDRWVQCSWELDVQHCDACLQDTQGDGRIEMVDPNGFCRANACCFHPKHVRRRRIYSRAGP